MTTTGDLFVNMRANTDGLRRGLQKSQRDIQQFSQKTEKLMSSGMGVQGLVAGGLALGPTIMSGLLNATRLPRLRRNDRQALQDYRRELKSGSVSDAVRQRRLQTSAAFRGASASAGRLMSMVGPLLSGPAVIAAAATVAGIIIANNAAKWSKRIMDSTQQFNAVVAREKAMAEMRDLKKDIRLARDPANQAAALFNLRAQEYRRNSGSPGMGTALTYAKGVRDYTLGGVNDYLTGQLPIGPGFPRYFFNLLRSLFTDGGVK